MRPSTPPSSLAPSDFKSPTIQSRRSTSSTLEGLGYPPAVRFVVLHAHPQQDCLNVVLRDRVVETLERAGHDVQVVRLTQGESIDGVSVVGAQGLVLVYPTWWGGLPAPMLGWVQRELGAWIDGAADLATSPLRTVRHLVAVTTHGSTRWVNWLQGEPGRHLLGRSVARLCAPGTRLRWVALYGVDQRSPAEVSAFVDGAAAEVAPIAA
ncbi:MAG: hypothetical protein F4126_00620 [Acidimicrobiaceae bacterium]|nr:hypothetical protein [Acidimicrobiaceae bacterium]